MRHFTADATVGLFPQPIRVPDGWLIMYHGVRPTMPTINYRLGLALLDLEDPRKVLRGPKAGFSSLSNSTNAVEMSIMLFSPADELW